MSSTSIVIYGCLIFASSVCLIFGFAFIIYVSQNEQKLIELVTPVNRGERSERRVIMELLKMGINPKAIFHDLYIQKLSGEYTQVDVAVATKAGIIVFEVKEYSGWIFGNEHQNYWTQLLSYGKEKHRFYNPIMQNAGHIKAIRQCLPQNRDIPIYSIIVFFGSCTFKNITCNANNTFLIYSHSINQVVSEILRQPDANFGNKYEIMRLFTKAVQNGNDPMIVATQINSAAYYGRNKPQSIHKSSFTSFIRFDRNPQRRRFW